MKKIFLALAMLLAFQSNTSMAKTKLSSHDIACFKGFIKDLVVCALSYRNLAPKPRFAAELACVADAKTDLKSCLTPQSNACVDSCNTTTNAAVAACNSNPDFDPNRCGADQTCVGILNQRKQDCILQATDDGDTCIAACGQ